MRTPHRITLVTAVVVGTVAGSLLAAVPPAAATSTSSVYVVDNGADQILSFPGNTPTGGPTPSTTQTLPGTVRPSGDAFDASGNLWVTDNNNGTIRELSAAQLDATPTSPTPAVTISPSAGLPNQPAGLAFDASANLWVADPGSNQVLEYLSSQLVTGSPAPHVILSGASIGLPEAVAFDAGGNLWVTNAVADTLIKFTPAQLAATGSPTPAVTISDNGGGSLGSPVGEAFDQSGDLWVVARTTLWVVEFTPAQLAATGNPTPNVIIHANGSSLCNPGLDAFDSSGNLWVANFGCGGGVPSVVRFSPAQLVNGTPVPAATISGGTSGLTGPTAVAFYRPAAPPSGGGGFSPPAPANTSTSLTSSANPVGAGQPLTLTAQVTPNPGGGTVEFTDGSTDIAGCSGVTVGSGGTATCPTTYGSVSTHSIVAKFLGNSASFAAFNPSASASLNQSVIPVITSLSPSSGPAVGGTVVTVSGGGFSTTSGGTTFSFGSNAGKAVTCSSTTTCVTTSPPAGFNGGTVDVTASVGGATSPVVAADQFAYQPCPVGSQRFVCHVYADLLMRFPDQTGLADWAGAVNAGVPRSAVALGVLDSPEYRVDLLQQWYGKFLRRQATPAGLSGWLGALGSGAGWDQIESGIIGSPEYFASRGGSTTSGFISAVYSDLLNRAPDAGGAGAWAGFLAAGNSGSAMADQIYGSTEGQSVVVGSVFAAHLGRPATSTDLNLWVPFLTGSSPLPTKDFVAEVIGSPEYYSRFAG